MQTAVHNPTAVLWEGKVNRSHRVPNSSDSWIVVTMSRTSLTQIKTCEYNYYYTKSKKVVSHNYCTLSKTVPITDANEPLANHEYQQKRYIIGNIQNQYVLTKVEQYLTSQQGSHK